MQVKINYFDLKSILIKSFLLEFICLFIQTFHRKLLFMNLNNLKNFTSVVTIFIGQLDHAPNSELNKDSVEAF